jgi:hypothetical protein
MMAAGNPANSADVARRVTPDFNKDMDFSSDVTRH